MINARTKLWIQHQSATQAGDYEKAFRIAANLKRVGVAPEIIEPIIAHDKARAEGDAVAALKAARRASSSLPHPLGKYVVETHQRSCSDNRPPQHHQQSNARAATGIPPENYSASGDW